jgi:phospholipid-transporting ATPase
MAGQGSRPRAQDPFVEPPRPYAHDAYQESQQSIASGTNPFSNYYEEDLLSDDEQLLYDTSMRDTAPRPLFDDDGAYEERNRQSRFGSIVGKVKDKVGYGQDTGHLPITEPSRHAVEEDRPTTPATKRKFLDFFKRKEVDPATLGPRIIHLNDPASNSANRYIDNHVSTAKYNVATFLPKFLLEQFSKYANLFFLFTSIIQQIPNVSPTNRWTTIGPLTVVLIVSAIREFVEDLKRHGQDRELNRSAAQVMVGTEFVHKRWVDIKVGDTVRVASEEAFPADLLLISSSEPEGLCYIETANLDGETNLKIKQALPETAHLVNPAELSRMPGKLKSEQPNNSLYTFEATLTIDTGAGMRELPLSPDQLLLRGAQLRNTQWIYGIVVFTGHETKLMRNATSTPIKITAVEKMVNIQIVFLFTILIVLAVVSSAGYLILNTIKGSQLSYLDISSTSKVGGFFLNLLTFWILYSNLVPISLFVTVELCKYVQAQLISADLDMYYNVTDTAANCRTSSLVEELGQIEYIFSDKTGTLTRNQMEFRQVSIAGIAYSEVVPEDNKGHYVDGEEFGVFDFSTLKQNLVEHPSRDIMHHFLTLLATCHTVIPERNGEKPGEIKYQAASPDEGALVQGACDLGYKFVARRPKSVSIEVRGQEHEFTLLNICEFNSTRKRMSTIFRCPDGRIRLYCKGADTVILERLRQGTPNIERTLQHLEEYATDGLRTLCLAYREIPESEYREWSAVFEKAATTINNRADELDKAAELIERDLTLLGASAIEDRLQEGVPETIATLQQAGIKVWVLTGDRQETAINIGMSCKLISEEMVLIIINEETKEATREALARRLHACRSTPQAEPEVFALVIDGKSLGFALEKDLEREFLDLAVLCKAVVCCRVSPLQKALVVKLVKKHLKAILLAIGDGANDVSMIQAAHVGIGISGMEGLQAARSADIAIGQFRFLRKLLLVHGAWSYQRLSKLILFSFYKNIALYMTQFWYAFSNGFSGQVIYESWTISLYNVLFTVLPPIVMGVFDQFISARLLDRYPQLYMLGQQGRFFNRSTFWSWVANGFYHSLIIYLAGVAIFWNDGIESDGIVGGHWVWGTTLYTAVLATVLGKAALITNLWTKWTWIAIPGSLAFWLGWLPLYALIAPAIGFSTEYTGIISHLYGNIVFWATVILLPVACLLRDFCWKYVKRMYYPQSYHHIQEIQKYNVADYRPRMEQFQKAIRKVRQVQRMRKQRGYAFSQGDEGAARVARAYDTTAGRGRFGEVLTSTQAESQKKQLSKGGVGIKVSNL